MFSYQQPHTYWKNYTIYFLSFHFSSLNSILPFSSSHKTSCLQCLRQSLNFPLAHWSLSISFFKISPQPNIMLQICYRADHRMLTASLYALQSHPQYLCKIGSRAPYFLSDAKICGCSSFLLIHNLYISSCLFQIISRLFKIPDTMKCGVNHYFTILCNKY